MGWLDYLIWVALGACAAGSFFFALAESALFALDKWRAQRLRQSSIAGADKVIEVLKDPQDLLGTLVLGNAFANAGIIMIGLWRVHQGQWPLVETLILGFLLILIVCEVIPKTLAVRAPEEWSLRLAAPVLILKRVIGPLRRVSQQLNVALLKAVIPSSIQPQAPLTDEEYQELLEMVFHQGALAQSEKEIILQIIRLDQRTVKEVMRPRAQMISAPDDATVEEMVEIARRNKLRRVCIYDETPDTIVGILNLRALFLDPERQLENAMEMPSFVPETMNLLQLLKSFQKQKRGLAIVLDEFGGTAGLVTMEDILEEVVGEMRREGEEESSAIVQLGEGRWRVKGTARLEEFRRVHPELEDVPDIETMGGLLTHQIGVVPAQGQSAVLNGLRLTAQIVDERRVRELLVERVKKKRAGSGL